MAKDVARRSATGDEATTKLLGGIPGTVFTTADNAYDGGAAERFDDRYAPGWDI